MNLNYSKTLPVRYDVDVFVIGGGPAGVAAAVSAANEGRSVLLVESFGAFGGAAVNALVPAFMQFGDGVNFLAGGIGKQVREYIRENCVAESKKCCPDSIPVETLKLCYDEMITKAGVQFRFFTSVSDMIVEDGTVQYAICSGKGEIFAVKAKMFIDCTGDGDAAVAAGAEFEMGDENGDTMAATLCALWHNIDWKRVVRPDSRRLDDAFADHVFTNEDRHLPGIWPISTSTGGSNAGHVYDIDGTSAESLTRGMVEGRRQLLEYRNYYKNYLTGYEESEPIISATQIGIRETRRIMGDYVLNVEDFLSRAVFADEIGRYAYPIDIHSGKNTAEGYKEYEKKFADLRYSKGESYGIPYRSILVKGLHNMYTAGRCISTDRSMQASVRVMPCCFITGQAAGTAAAMAVETNVDSRGIDIVELQRRLQENGTYITPAAAE
ncbi:MAG: FAD-dependent oxidoreductase [Clostridia bacterium]|nr:FAD-dependent oxidoreductase [Clostridia bacterium]